MSGHKPDAVAGPEMGAARGALGGYLVALVRPMSGVSGCGQCRWLQSSLRVSPAGGRGCMGRVRVGGRRSGGVNQGGALAALGAAGQTLRRPRAWPLASQAVHAAWCLAWGGGRGQAADLPVAQAVEDQGQEPAGGGDLRDVLGFFAAAGDDCVFDPRR